MTEPPADRSLLQPFTRVSRQWWHVFLAAALASVLAVLAVTVLLNGGSSLRGSLPEASAQAVTWAVWLPVGLVVVLLPAGGRLAARLGRRLLYVLGAVLVAVASVVAALAPSAQVLIGARALQGVGTGLVLPASLALVIATADGSRRRTVRWLWSGGVAVAALLGLVLGWWLGSAQTSPGRGSWRVAFWVLAVLLLLVVLAARRLLLESRPLRYTGPVETIGIMGGPRPMARTGAGPTVEVALLDRLPERTRQQLTSGTPRHVPAGELIVREGDPGDSLFVITTGRAEVIVGGVVVRELGPGAVVGELALLTGRPRSASVRARRDCQVIEVPTEVWESVLRSDPEAVHVLVTGLAEQLADARPATAPADPAPTVLGIVRAPGTGHEVVGPLVERLGQSLLADLSALGRPRRLEPSEAARLEDAERENDWVVLCADGSDPGWTELVLRQSDRLVVVADAAGPPVSLPRAFAHRPELVLVGRRPDSRAFGSWTDTLDPWRISVVREDRWDRDLRPLLDRLTGRSVGVVLSGGGARALTHVGVLLELEEAGIVIDRVAGASLGAIVGSIYAAGASAAECAERAYSAFVRGRPLGDYSLSGTALTRGVRHRRLIEDHLGSLLIEELPRGFACVSVDLESRGLIVHRSGPAALAVVASSRLPMVFPPVVDGDRLLIDGGALDNLPVHLLTERDEGPVIAVNVLPEPEDPLEGAASGPVIPSFRETVIRIVGINADEEGRAIAAGAYVLTPRTMGVGVLEFHQFDHMVASGRAAARELLEATGGDLRRRPG